MKYYLAVDIGASSGRHIIGWKQDGEIRTDEVFRFPNGMKSIDGRLIWDIEELFQSVKEGIRAAFAKYPQIESLAIDTWGVDYVLMDGDREILPCYAYRDRRTERTIPQVHNILPFERLYEKTGIQFQTFNTVYQMYDDLQAGRLEQATDFLMMPEYLSYKLTGIKRHEYTNASTTGMLNARTGEFDEEIVEKLGYPKGLFGELSQPGTALGALLPEIAAYVGGNTKVVFCASHDTASAVEGATSGDNPYISSGTWSLFGVKLPHAILDERSRKSNYTNEGGVGYVRFLKNIMGMWIVNSLRKELCPGKGFDVICKEAEKSAFRGLIDVNDESFLAPESMKEAFDRWFEKSGEKPRTESDYFNCAFLSLAAEYGRALAELESVTGRKYDTLYIVGGGAKNAYLNALTERACNIKVKALPIEATAIGNLKIQTEA
ncbi:MAG: rhamnulokinase family protein [Candidatus Gallimonas sp.]